MDTLIRDEPNSVANTGDNREILEDFPTEIEVTNSNPTNYLAAEKKVIALFYR